MAWTYRHCVEEASMINKRRKTHAVVISVAACLTGIMLFNPAGGSPQDKRDAVVVVDPLNKREIAGSIGMALAWGTQMRPPRQYVRGLKHLTNALHSWTRINVNVTDHIFLSSSELHNLPFIYIAADEAFELTDIETANVRKYLTGGGFMVMDNSYPPTEFSPVQASIRQMIREVLGSHARLVPIPKSHEMYHCFFDFTDGPPRGSECEMEHEPVYYLEGVWYGDRLVAVICNKNYIRNWALTEDNQPQLKMGVNMVVFALTQKGGLTRQIERMESRSGNLLLHL